MTRLDLSGLWGALLKGFILPILFIVHYLQAYFPFLTIAQVAGFAGIHFFMAIVLVLLFYLLFRNAEKALLAELICFAVYFFFSAFHDFIKGLFGDILFTRYRFLLPLIGLGLMITFFWLGRTKRSLKPLSGYAVTVFTLFIFMDAGIIVYKMLNPKGSGRVTLMEDIAPDAPACDTCRKPDVYFIIFDEYTSTKVLRENYSYDNSQFETFFRQQGFEIMTQSHANYYWTLLCLPAMLNMSYLEAVDRKKMKYEDFVSATNLIKHNRVVELFRRQGYRFVNISPFDFVDQEKTIPYAYEEDAVKAMYAHTFFKTVRNDLGWKYIKPSTDTMPMGKMHADGLWQVERTIRSLKEASQVKENSPRFIYGHLFMPHWPFSFDSSGKRKTVIELYADTSTALQVRSYLQYLPYVNRRITDLIRYIKNRTGGRSVIIAMGDHGYRPESNELAEPYYFSNFNAVYLPEGMKNLFYENISGVNQFRVLLNGLFNTNIPLAKDSICNWHTAKDK